MSTLIEEPVVKDEVQDLLEQRLGAFVDEVEKHENLDIDHDIEADLPQEHVFKILNHRMKAAYSISIDAVVKQELGGIIEALDSGEITKLHGVTRIVGYYSRTTNWNKSKVGELKDRHTGNYSV